MPAQSDAENRPRRNSPPPRSTRTARRHARIAATIRIYRGWPNTAALDADLAAGRVNVTVFPVPGATRNTTRYAPDWLPDPVTPTLTVTVAGATATFAGTADPGQLAGLLVEGRLRPPHRRRRHPRPGRRHPRRRHHAHPAALPPAPASPARRRHLVARTAADATAAQELRRQQQAFRITAWCPTPDLRDAACEAIDVACAATPFLTLAGGSAGRLRFASTTTFDHRQDAALYRRDLLYTVEFPTTQVATSHRCSSALWASAPITITA